MPQFLAKSQNITIPKFFIEILMPDANATFVKVYLYALLLANDNASIDNSTIANKLGILESDVVGAFSYWQSRGILDVGDGVIEFLPMPAAQIYGGEVQSAPKKASAPPVRTNEASRPAPAKTAVEPQQADKYTSEEVAKAISENSVLSELTMVAQEMLGKPLNTQDTKTLFSLYDWLGFQPEIILLLIDYCVSMGKSNMKYIEKTAIAWHEKGLFTAEAVTEYLQSSKKKNTYNYAVRKILGITDRKLAPKENNYIDMWGEEYKMSEEMVALAYEYCVMQTQKLSMPYMDKVLSNWHAQGIYTIDAAKKASENFKLQNGQNRQQNYAPKRNDYDYKQIEKQILDNAKK